MTNFLSLVSGSDFSPRLSGGATQSSSGDGAFVGLLGEKPLSAPMQGANAANASLPTTAGMTALVANDAYIPSATIKGIDVAAWGSPPLAAGTVASEPSAEATQKIGGIFAPEPSPDAGELIALGDPATTDTVSSAEDSAYSSSSAEQSNAQSKIPGEMVSIGSTDKNIVENQLADASLSLDVAANEGAAGSEKPMDGAQSLSETATPDRSPNSDSVKTEPSTHGLAASALPTPVPAEASKQKLSALEESETFDSSEDGSVSDNLRGDRAAPRSGGAQAPRALSVPTQAGTDGLPSEFARHLPNDGGGGTSPIVSAAGATSEHAATGSNEAIRLPSNISSTDAVIAARAGQIGKDLAVEIAKHTNDGRDSLTIRLDPAELGRIHVRMHFDDQGSLRALVTAESHAALDMLRRESQDLARALGDAGVRTDAQSFRFDGRGQDGSQHGQRHAQAWQRNDTQGHAGDPLPEEPVYRRLRSNGAVDLFA